MARAQLIVCALFAVVSSFAVATIGEGALAGGQIRSVSEGSDCRCSCVLKPRDLGPCPNSPQLRDIRYAVDTVSGGDDCRCSCFASLPPDTCQLPVSTNDHDSRTTASRDLGAIKRAITGTDQDQIHSSLKDIANALADLQSILLGKDDDAPSTVTTTAPKDSGIRKETESDTKGQKDDSQISRNQTFANGTDGRPPADVSTDASYDEVDGFLHKVLSQLAEEATTTSYSIANRTSGVTSTQETTFAPPPTKPSTMEAESTSSSTVKGSSEPDPAFPVSNWTEHSDVHERNDTKDTGPRGEALVHPPVVEITNPTAASTGDHSVEETSEQHNHSSQDIPTTIQNDVSNISATTLGLETTAASVVSTEDAPLLRTSTQTFTGEITSPVGISQSVVNDNVVATSFPVMPASKGGSSSNGRVNFIPYRDHDFDVAGAAPEADEVDHEKDENYSYDYGDEKETETIPRSSLVSGRTVKQGADEFDVVAKESATEAVLNAADLRTTSLPAVDVETTKPPKAATTPTTTARPHKVTQNSTVSTVEEARPRTVSTASAPATTSSTSLDDRQVMQNGTGAAFTNASAVSSTAPATTTSASAAATPAQSGDGDLKASYYSTVDDDEGVEPTDEDLLEEEDFYLDYDEDTTTPATTTPTTTPEPPCGTLFNLSLPRLVHDFGRREGNWLVDPRPVRNTLGKIYVTNFYYGNTLIEFDSMLAFKKFRWSHSHMLPYSWIGTGHIIYNGSFYYNRAFSRNIIKYNLKKRFVSAWGHLRNAVYDSTTPFTWRGHTMVHMAADESGLWVIYAAHSDFGRHSHSQHYVVNKINPVDLQTIHSWRTPIRRRGISHLFIICGVVYATDRYDSRRARITQAFDTHTGVRRYLFIPFFNQFAYNVQLLYNPKERRLYSWDKGHQMLYDVNFTY